MKRAATDSQTITDKRMEAVVTTAAKLFAQKGFAETSIAELTEATGLQRGGLYHYINSKQDLLFAIHERAQAPLINRILEIEKRKAPPKESLRELARAMLAGIEQFHDEVVVFFSEWRTINHDPRWEGVRHTRRKIEEVFEHTIARGEKDGIFELKDRKLTILAFIGMLNYSHQWLDPRGRMRPQDIADLFTDIFLNGIQKS